MENPLLYSGKNEVAGMEKKLVRILALGGKKCCQRKQNARATEWKLSTFIQQWKTEKGPTFQKWVPFMRNKKEMYFFQHILHDSCLIVVLNFRFPYYITIWLKNAVLASASKVSEI